MSHSLTANSLPAEGWLRRAATLLYRKPNLYLSLLLVPPLPMVSSVSPPKVNRRFKSMSTFLDTLVVSSMSIHFPSPTY